MRRFSLAMAAVAACIAAIATGAVAEPRPDGLWFSTPKLPADSELYDTQVNETTGNASFTYMIDSGLAFVVLERFESEEKGLGDIADTVAEFESIDADTVNVVTSSDDSTLDKIASAAEAAFGKEQAQALSENYSYPVAIAEYFTGDNEDSRKNTDLFIATDQWIFRVHIAISVDAEEDYRGLVPGWLGSMALED